MAVPAGLRLLLGMEPARSPANNGLLLESAVVRWRRRVTSVVGLATLLLLLRTLGGGRRKQRRGARA